MLGRRSIGGTAWRYRHCVEKNTFPFIRLPVYVNHVERSYLPKRSSGGFGIAHEIHTGNGNIFIMKTH